MARVAFEGGTEGGERRDWVSEQRCSGAAVQRSVSPEEEIGDESGDESGDEIGEERGEACEPPGPYAAEHATRVAGATVHARP